MDGTAEQISALLESVSYPTTKPALIAAACDQGLPIELLDRIERLPGGHFLDADEVGRELAKSRASSNPALVAISVQVCETCGFPRRPGEPHSCVEEKARFAESANRVTDEFETLDDGRA
jgi:Protein of unknown function (DUF2795)